MLWETVHLCATHRCCFSGFPKTVSALTLQWLKKTVHVPLKECRSHFKNRKNVQQTYLSFHNILRHCQSHVSTTVCNDRLLSSWRLNAKKSPVSPSSFVFHSLLLGEKSDFLRTTERSLSVNASLVTQCLRSVNLSFLKIPKAPKNLLFYSLDSPSRIQMWILGHATKSTYFSKCKQKTYSVILNGKYVCVSINYTGNSARVSVLNSE